MVASEGSTSYAIFTYKCDLLQWTRHNAAIGYSAGLDYYENHPLSRTSNVINIDCVNYPHSVWSNVVYKLNEGMNYIKSSHLINHIMWMSVIFWMNYILYVQCVYVKDKYETIVNLLKAS